MVDPTLRKTLLSMAVLYNRQFTPDAADLLISDLSGYPESIILESLTRCRKELRTFPTVADILTRIDDGRPGVEEAWVMLPKSETESVIWTGEMSEAYRRVRPAMLEGDMIEARMAFKEVYSKLLADARLNHKAPNWMPSLGLDQRGRELAIRDAQEKGRISHAHAQSLLPAPTQKQVAGPSDDDALSAVGFQDVMAKILEMAPARLKMLAQKPFDDHPMHDDAIAERKMALKRQAEQIKKRHEEDTKTVTTERAISAGSERK